MPRTGLAATALSLVAVLAACGTDGRPEADRPEATESSRSHDPSVTETATRPGARPLTYSDDFTADPDPEIHWLMKSIEYGDRTLRPGIDATAMDITDDGLVMVAPDGGIHFTDGQTTEKIGETAILEGLSWAGWGVKTSTSGSLAAWFTPEGRDRLLVVYDTDERQVLTQVPAAHCQHQCQLVAVVGEHVYWSEEPGPNWSTGKRWLGRPLMMLDVPDGTVSETDVRALAEDLRSHPRGFVMGDDYDTGEVVNQDIDIEAVFFAPRGSTLELQRIVRGEGTDAPVYGHGGFDTSGRRLSLRLPAGFTPAEEFYGLFQWLDDDRFAVMAGATRNFGLEGQSGYGDVLVCDIARERCTLAVPGPPGGATGAQDGFAQFRLVPHLTLPN